MFTCEGLNAVECARLILSQVTMDDARRLGVIVGWLLLVVAVGAVLYAISEIWRER